MKYKKTSIIFTAICILALLVLMAGCEGMGITPAPVPTTTDQPVNPAPVPGAEASSLIPTANNTYDIGKSTKVWRSVYASNNITIGGYLMTFPGSAQTLVGLTSSDTLTNKTLTAPTINAATLSGNLGGSPAFTGTPTFVNHATGTFSYTAGSTSKVITHGMSGTPTRIFFSLGGCPGIASSATGANTIYWDTANTTAYTIHSAVSTNATVNVYWLAYIADE
jgi:hypothetical protein